jgi:hypothetical protein
LRTKEIELARAIIETDKEASEVDMKLQNLSIAASINEDKDDQTTSDRIRVIEQLKDQRASLSASRKAFEGLVSEAHHTRTGQRISHVNMRDGGKLLVGLINTDGGEGQAVQEIHDINAQRGGMGIVGIAKGVDINGFFKNRPPQTGSSD